MSQEKRALLAGILSLVVLLLWSHFYGGKPVSPPLPEKGTVSLGGKPVTIQEEETKEPQQTFDFESEQVAWTVALPGARLQQALLKNYHPIDLILSEQEKALSFSCADCNFSLPPDSAYRLIAKGEGEANFAAESAGILVRKVYRFPPREGYPFELGLTVENHTGQPLSGRVGIVWKGAQQPEQQARLFGFLKRPTDQRSFVYQLAGKVEHAGRRDEAKEIVGPVAWAGIEDRYFLISLISHRLSSEGSLKMVRAPGWVTLSLSPASVAIPPGGSHEENFTVYVGPKDRELLKKVGAGLEKAVDYGFFSIFAIPILKLLLVFHSWVKNWGIAIILLTVVVKLLLNPLSIKSLQQMKEMQKLQPRLTEMKEKYKNDRQRLNMETMQLFKTHKVNPLGGCLPMVVQMPIYIALYKVLYNSIELYHAPFFGFYRDLSASDPYFILPVLLGVFMVAQQKMSPNPSADPTQRQMMMLMPILFTAFMLFLPVGLVLYILVNTVMTVGQQYLYQHDMKLRGLVGLVKRS